MACVLGWGFYDGGVKKMNLVVLFLICGWVGWQQFQIVQLKSAIFEQVNQSQDSIEDVSVRLNRVRDLVNSLAESSSDLWNVVNRHGDRSREDFNSIRKIKGEVGARSADIESLKERISEMEYEIDREKKQRALNKLLGH